LRTFEEMVAYAPNQAYIGNILPDELKDIETPWYEEENFIEGGRFGDFGEIMPEDEFYALLKHVDVFDLVKLNKEFIAEIEAKVSEHPILKEMKIELGEGEELSELEALLDNHAEPLYLGEKLVGCVKRAHESDVNLNAHTILENLVAKASAVLSIKNMALKNDLDLTDVDYVLECSEEACGDINQRGGGNFAKAIAEMAGCVNANGSDVRSFCAAPAHAVVNAAALVKAGIYDNVVVAAGGSVAKLGMNGKDHIKKEMPILEDTLGGFAVLISNNDGASPVIRTDIIGRHKVGTGSSPQAVISSLVTDPLDENNLGIKDIDKYSVEMQNPEVTKPAGAGDVPESNYKMIAALGVKRGDLERKELMNFVKEHGMPGFAPTQGHIPSGVPFIGPAAKMMRDGQIEKAMIIGKGSLFLGRMTNLFKKKIGLTLLDSEHGIDELKKAARLAENNYNDLEVELIGCEGDKCSCLADAHSIMDQKLEENEIDAAVTLHYNFPLGVSTVGRVVTPGQGKEMLIATTTGTTDTNRVPSMLKNTIYGIAAAKSLGIEKPTVGILNVEGARLVEKNLQKLKENGYEFEFATSVRADGGSVMRGNDLLLGVPDIMVTDTLTGNMLMKVFSAFNTGGQYEAVGYGYGPGVGEDYDKLIGIISRASGAPVIANAIKFMAEVSKGNLLEITEIEMKAANNAGLKNIISEIKNSSSTAEAEAVKEPTKKITDEEIAGIDILEIDAAKETLWKKDIYAETGMGCTGPVILIAEEDEAEARAELKKAGFVE
ncbi:MAG: betaine reductase, partial [Halanaerobium sp.]